MMGSEDYQDLDDKHLVELSKEGNKNAFAALFGKHHVEVRKACIFFLRNNRHVNEQDIEDVTQITFLKAYNGIRKFKCRSEFGTWVISIARRACLDLLRKIKSRVEILVDPPREIRDGNESVAGDTEPESEEQIAEMVEVVNRGRLQLKSSSRTNVELEEKIERAEKKLKEAIEEVVAEGVTSETVANAIRGLKPRERQVLVLLYWRGLTIKEIAALYEVGEQYVKNLLARARKSIREKCFMSDIISELERLKLPRISIRDSRPSDVRRLGLDAVKGAFAVFADGDDSSAESGILKDDLITEFNGEKVENQADFLHALRDIDPGEIVKLTIIRDKHKRSLKIKTPMQ